MQRIRPKIALRGFKPGANGAAHVLGELESSVMEILWNESGRSVTEVEDELRKRRNIAHTTVLTTLDRMFRKGYLSREKQGKAFVYSASYSRDEFERGLAQELLRAFLKPNRTPALTARADLASDNAHTPQQLEAIIPEKRRTRVSRK